MFDKGVGQMGEIIEALHPTVISFFGEGTEHGGTTNFVLRGD